MTILLWSLFVLLVLVLITLDLRLFHNRPHALLLKEALVWSLVWILLGLSFSVFIYFSYDRQWFGLGQTADIVDGGVFNTGKTATLKYLTGYIVEKSLSVDNIFVIAMIFTIFGIPAMYQRRVLLWGILGALILRGIVILVGIQIIMMFHFVLYIFGGLLVFMGIKILVTKMGDIDPSKNLAVRITKRFLPMTDKFYGVQFIAKERYFTVFTPLFSALVAVEISDVIFAMDSIPAILVITSDSFLVFTSNVFAILGLRALYFVLAGMLDKFHYLQTSLAIVLTVVGGKMLLSPWLKGIDTNMNLWLLVVICIILGGGVLCSMMSKQKVVSL